MKAAWAYCLRIHRAFGEKPVRAREMTNWILPMTDNIIMSFVYVHVCVCVCVYMYTYVTRMFCACI